MSEEQKGLKPKRRKKSTWVSLGTIALLVIFFVLWKTGKISNYLPNTNFHLRGAFDRETLVVKDCVSGKSYTLLLRSEQKFRLFDLEHDLHANPAEPLLIDFDAQGVPLRMPWQPANAVRPANAEMIKLEPGTCGG